MSHPSWIKRVVFFPRLRTKNQPLAATFHRERWIRWTASATRDDATNPKSGLKRQIFDALRSELYQSAMLIITHAISAFGAAWLLKLFLARLLSPVEGHWHIFALSGAMMISTLIAWISLNHVFFVAELIGIGARTYVERRILLAAGKHFAFSDGNSSLVSLFDREGGRIESAWRGGIILVLAISTVIFTSSFFFIALGFSAVAALGTLIACSIIVARIAKSISGTYHHISVFSGKRIELASYALKNRLFIVLNQWQDSILDAYKKTPR